MAEAEGALQLRVEKLRAKGKWHRSGAICWKGSRGGSVAFRVVEYLHEAEVILDYQVNGRPMHETISCETTYQRVGRRWWFLCPRCRRRMGVLYLPSGRSAFRCRDCYHLRYRSQEKDLDFVLRPVMAATGVPRRIARHLLRDSLTAGGAP
jgi:tRNA(Ile2) C34 agmatinyltransferase TiaS